MSPSLRLYKNKSDSDITAFHSIVAKVDWIQMLQENNAKLPYNLFIRIPENLYDISFPLVKARKHTNARKPWITPNLRRIRERNK